MVSTGPCEVLGVGSNPIARSTFFFGILAQWLEQRTFRYFLDLVNPEKKLYIEVDGEQHYNDQKVVEHDKVRTKRLEDLGWKCLRRIRWSDYKRLSKEAQESLITELQNQIQ